MFEKDGVREMVKFQSSLTFLFLLLKNHRCRHGLQMAQFGGIGPSAMVIGYALLFQVHGFNFF